MTKAESSRKELP